METETQFRGLDIVADVDRWEGDSVTPGTVDVTILSVSLADPAEFELHAWEGLLGDLTAGARSTILAGMESTGRILPGIERRIRGQWRDAIEDAVLEKGL